MAKCPHVGSAVQGWMSMSGPGWAVCGGDTCLSGDTCQHEGQQTVSTACCLPPPVTHVLYCPMLLHCTYCHRRSPSVALLALAPMRHGCQTFYLIHLNCRPPYYNIILDNRLQVWLSTSIASMESMCWNSDKNRLRQSSRHKSVSL